MKSETVKNIDFRISNMGPNPGSTSYYLHGQKNYLTYFYLKFFICNMAVLVLDIDIFRYLDTASK